MARRSRSFTFIELIIVMVIIGVLCSAAYPRARRQFAFLQLDSFSKRLLALCAYASNRAVVEQNITRLVIDKEMNTVDLTLAGKKFRDFAIPPGLSIKKEKAEAVFYPDGTNERFSIGVTGGYGGRSTVSARNSYGGFQIEYPE